MDEERAERLKKLEEDLLYCGCNTTCTEEAIKGYKHVKPIDEKELNEIDNLNLKRWETQYRHDVEESKIRHKQVLEEIKRRNIKWGP